jgi:hypothetical protein
MAISFCMGGGAGLGEEGPARWLEGPFGRRQRFLRRQKKPAHEVPENFTLRSSLR